VFPDAHQLPVHNTAQSAGGLGNDGGSSPVLYHCTFTNNRAVDYGAPLYQGTGPASASGIVYGSSGHLRVTVLPTNALVEYMRSYRPADEGPGATNRMVSCSYIIPPMAGFVDSVGDGIPDWWRAKYFGGTGTTTNNLSCAACDPDGDGMSNGQEYVADTNPTNAASRLAIIGVRPQTNGLGISWVGGTGATQIVECRRKLGEADAAWAALFTNLPPTGLSNSFLDASPGTNGFYRVKAWR
jgi:hypothetical protein